MANSCANSSMTASRRRQRRSKISLPWHILPHKAADNRIQEKSLTLKATTDTFRIRNPKGAVEGVSELFALTGVSPVDYPLPPEPGAQVATPDLGAVGVRYLPDLGGLLQFAIATHDERSHANYPAELDVYLDTTGDGEFDYVIATIENGGFAATGQNVTILVTYRSFETVGVFFFTDADLNSQTVILTVPIAALGITPDQSFGFLAAAFDNYFTGNLSDLIDDGGNLMQFTPSQPKFAVSTPGVSVPPFGTRTVSVTFNPAGNESSPSQQGVLALHRDAKSGAWWDVLPVTVK